MIHIDRSMSKFMNWNQVIEMSNDNITIGSHTVTHPIMSRLNNAEISYEINTSKEVDSLCCLLQLIFLHWY